MKSWLGHFKGAALIVLAALAAYHNSFHGPFIFDDLDSILDNQTIHRLWPVWQALTPVHHGGATVEARPITNFSLAINYAVNGLRVAGFHAVNLAIHMAAGLVLFGIVRRTLTQPPLRPRFGRAALPLALIIAAIWTVHPLQTESVTYIVQRAESMMGLFYLLTLYCAIRGAESEAENPKSETRNPKPISQKVPKSWYALSVVSCLLGMASKEVMVSAPLMVLLYDRTFQCGSFAEAWRRRWRLYLALAATWVLLAYLMVTTGGNRGGSAGVGRGMAWQAYALTQLQAIPHYLRLSIWPHPLVLDYGTMLAHGPAEILPGALVVAALLAGTLIAVYRWPSAGFLGVWFLAILAPSSSVIPVVVQTIAEHRMYLPLAAVVTALVLGGFEIGRQPFNKEQGIVLACVAGGSVVVLFTFLTIQRNRDYRSALTIWRDTVEKCPNNARAHNNLGFSLEQAGQVQEAIGHYERALQFDPEFPDAHNNLGVALADQGRLPEAISHYEQALRIKPDYAKAYNNLGFGLAQLGRLPEAISHYEMALRLKPDYAEPHYNLGNVSLQRGNLPEAIGHYEQALRIKPDYAEAHNNLGVALARTGQVQEAIEHWNQALAIKPDYVQARSNLARARAAPSTFQP